MSARNDFDDFLLSLSSPEGTNQALVIELMRRWEDFKLSRQVPATPNFNWVVFTEDGFGFDLWSPKDWRGDSRNNWDDSVKTFILLSEAQEFVLMNQPIISIQNVMDRLHSYFGNNQSAAFENIRHFVKSKQRGV